MIDTIKQLLARALSIALRIHSAFRIPNSTFAFAFALCSSPLLADWPMLAHDAAQLAHSATQLEGPFARKWYRAFVDEGIMAGVQPVTDDRASLHRHHARDRPCDRC